MELNVFRPVQGFTPCTTCARNVQADLLQVQRITLAQHYLKLIHSAAQAKMLENAEQKFCSLCWTVNVCTARIRIQQQVSEFI